MFIESNDYSNEKLQNLINEHNELLRHIDNEKKQKIPNDLIIHKMKKKLAPLESQINEIKSRQYPDIIA